MAVGEVVTDFTPIEEGQIITSFKPIETGVVPPPKSYQPEPPPFKIDEFVNDWQKTRSMDEDPPQEDLANIFSRIKTPFEKLGYSAAGALNRQLGALFTNFDTVFEYAEEKRVKAGGKPIPPEKRGHLFKKMAETYDENADYWQTLASKSPPDFINEFIGKFAGSLGPGMVEFGISLASLLTYPAILGAAEAKKQGAGGWGEATGAFLKSAEVALLGLIFKGLHPYGIYTKAPILGTTFGIEDAVKQFVTTGKVDPDQVIEATATGFGLGLTPGGRMGLKDIAKNLKIELPKIEAKIEAKKIYEVGKAKEVIEPSRTVMPTEEFQKLTEKTVDGLIEKKIAMPFEREKLIKQMTEERPEGFPVKEVKPAAKVEGVKPSIESLPQGKVSKEAVPVSEEGGKRAKEPSGDILSWTRSKGGLDPNTVSADLQSLTQKESGFRGKSSIVRKGGRPADELVQEWGWEKGQEISTDEYVDAIKSAVESKKVGVERPPGVGSTDLELERYMRRQEEDYYRNQIYDKDPGLDKPETIKKLTESFDDEIMGFKEELREDGYSEENITRTIEKIKEDIEFEARPPDFERFKKELAEELIPLPAPSPTRKGETLLPGMKVGLEMPSKGIEVTPTLEGTPLMEAARKAEQEKVQPTFEQLRQEQLAKEQRGSVQIGKEQPQPFTFTDPKIEKSYQESVPKKESFFSKAGEYFTDMWHKMTRPYEYIPRNKEFAQLQFDLTKLGKQKGVASYDATMKATKYLVGLKDPADMDLFSRIVVLENLEVRAERGLDLPWGFDLEGVQTELGRLRKEVENRPNVKEAVELREIARDKLTEEYINSDAALSPDPKAEKERLQKQFSNKKYFRHQVLEYINLKGLFGTGKKLKEPLGRGFLKKAKGSELDINRDVLEPDYEVMAQMLYDIQVNKTIKAVDENYSITDQVKKDAKKQELDDWHKAIPEGYVTWQPREGNIFYMTDSIPAKLAEKLHSGALEELGITKDDLRSALAIGGKRKEFVVKEEIAKTLDELVKTRTPSVLGDADRALMRGIKAWFLFAPRRYLKYEFRNMTGDSDAAFVGNPSGFLKTPKATKELGDVLFGKKEITGELKDFFDRGGFDSTLFAQEMGDLQSLWTFERLYKEQTPGVAEIPYRVWKKYWKTIRVTNTFRETILRYGNYLDYLEQMEKNPEGRPDNFGGSKPDEIMGLKDIKDRAYWLSNDLIGPYDRISVMGQNIRQYWYPFWSWKELNFKRYVQFAKNAALDGRLAEMAGKKMLGTAAKTPYMAYKVGKFLISATAFWSALQVWNHTVFPQEEDDLADDIKSNPHIVFGRDSEDNIIYFNRIGALGDFLEWFGLDDSPKYVDKWMKGEMTLKEIAEDMVKSPVNMIVQGITPQVKIPAELITGRTLFPDVFEPGTIRDRGLYLSRSLGLEGEYKAIAGLPSKGYQESLKNFFVYTADPGQGAYADIQDTKRRWLKEQGKGAEGFWLTPKGNALYNLKLAIRYKDEEALRKYMYEYFTLGGTAKGIEESLDRMNPLSGLSKRDRSLFEQSLSSDQVKRLEKAMEFYYGTLKGGTK